MEDKKNRISFEITSIVCLTLIGHFLFAQLDVAEQYTQYSATVENYEVDELIFTTLLFSLLMTLFAYKRWRELLSMYKEQTLLKTRLENVNDALISANRDNMALTKQITITQDEERHRLVLEMHDVFGQHLAAIDANLSSIINSNEENEKFHKRVNSALNSTRFLSEITSKKLRNLKPPNLNLLSLREALNQLVNDWSETHKELHIDMSFTETLKLHESIKHAIYRIVQESLNNIVKHANASKILIKIDLVDENYLSLMIEDDGNGIVERNKSKQGLGLEGMRYRAEALNGKFIISPNVPKGTVINVTIPINNALV